MGLCRYPLRLTGSSIIADTQAVARAAPPLTAPPVLCCFCGLFPRSGPADAPPPRGLIPRPWPSVAPAALGLCGVVACSAALAPVGPGRSNWRRRQSVAAAALAAAAFLYRGGKVRGGARRYRGLSGSFPVRPGVRPVRGALYENSRKSVGRLERRPLRVYGKIFWNSVHGPAGCPARTKEIRWYGVWAERVSGPYRDRSNAESSLTITAAAARVK